MSTLLTDLASLLLTCADATVGELPSYLKLHVLPHLPISPGLQVRHSGNTHIFLQMARYCRPSMQSGSARRGLDTHASKRSPALAVGRARSMQRLV